MVMVVGLVVALEWHRRWHRVRVEQRRRVHELKGIRPKVGVLEQVHVAKTALFSSSIKSIKLHRVQKEFRKEAAKDFTSDSRFLSHGNRGEERAFLSRAMRMFWKRGKNILILKIISLRVEGTYVGLSGPVFCTVLRAVTVE